MTFRIDVNVNVKEFGPIVRDSVKELAKNIRTRSNRDIRSAGKFGRRFNVGTHIRAIDGGAGFRLRVYQRPAFAKVFEYGAPASVGKPLLWIPRKGTQYYGVRAIAWQTLIRPRTKGILGLFGRYRNVLIDKRTHKVVYVGVRQTRNVQRFHIRDISYREAENFLKTMGQTAGIPT
jgi:hypothetical protein